MAVTVTMPQLGESVTEGTIGKWLKQPGEKVERYESIAEVISDKVNAEIPAPQEGVMGEHLVEEGAVVPVGQPICVIEEAGGVPGAAPEAAQPEAAPPAAEAAVREERAGETAQPQPAPPQTAAAGAGGAMGGQADQLPPGAPPSVRSGAVLPPGGPPPSGAPSQEQPAAQPAAQRPAAARAPAATEGAGDGHTLHVTPAVRMLAREHGVDLDQVQGTGIAGRVTKKDVLEHVQRRDAGELPARAPEPESVVAAPAGPAATAPPAPAAAPAPAPAAEQGDTVVPLTPMRRAIAEHMVRSRQTSPHAWVMVEVDMTATIRLRDSRRDEFKRRTGTDLTFLPIVGRVVVAALQSHPSLNASWSDQGIVVKRDINLGIAVALEDNLIVPVVRNAERLNLEGLAVAVNDLVDRTRRHKLRVDEVQGGTFTLNNAGALGTVLSQAIINQPQAAILVMDSIVKRPVVVEGDAIVVRPMMNLSVSFDHRLNDGLQAARFLGTCKRSLEGLGDSGGLL